MTTQRTRTRQLGAAQHLLGPSRQLRALGLGFSGPNPARTVLLVIGGDLLLLVTTYLFTGRVIGLGLVLLAALLIVANQPRALGVTDSEVIVFRRSLWNGMPTAIAGHLSMAALVATPLPVSRFVAVGEGSERIWVGAGDYLRLVARVAGLTALRGAVTGGSLG